MAIHTCSPPSGVVLNRFPKRHDFLWDKLKPIRRGHETDEYYTTVGGHVCIFSVKNMRLVPPTHEVVTIVQSGSGGSFVFIVNHSPTSPVSLFEVLPQ